LVLGLEADYAEDPENSPTAILYDLNAWISVKKIQCNNHHSNIEKCVLTPDGVVVFALTNFGGIWINNSEDVSRSKQILKASFISDVIVNNNSLYCVLNSSEQIVFDLIADDVIRHYVEAVDEESGDAYHDPEAYNTMARITSDGQRIVLLNAIKGHSQYYFLCKEFASDKIIWKSPAFKENQRSMVIDSQNKFLVHQGDSSKFISLDLLTGEQVNKFEWTEKETIKNWSLSASGQYLAVISSSGPMWDCHYHLTLVDFQQNQIVSKLPISEGYYGHLIFVEEHYVALSWSFKERRELIFYQISL
jgi:hypothetical protein